MVVKLEYVICMLVHFCQYKCMDVQGFNFVLVGFDLSLYYSSFPLGTGSLIGSYRFWLGRLMIFSSFGKTKTVDYCSSVYLRGSNASIL